MLSLTDSTTTATTSSSSAAADSPSPTLRRRNSIATTTIVVPTTLNPLHFSTFSAAVSAAPPPPPPPLDFELISLKTSSAGAAAYTSLRDIIPSSPANSPTAAYDGASRSISIRNRLVKQAAWAYLQPMSASPSSAGPPLLRRLWRRLSAAAASCLARLRRHLAGALDCVLRALRVRAYR